LRSSNTSRDGAVGHSRTCRWLLAALAAAYLASTAQALDPNRAMSQYIRDHWDAGQGFPGGTVFAITQTADGYLWIGTEKGLIRFDGFTFRLMDRAPSTALPAGPVLGLATDSEGNLWIRPRGQGLLRYRGGAFQDVSLHLQGDTSATAMGRSRNGEILVARPNGTITYGSRRLASFGRLFPLIISIAETADGEVWMGTRDAGLFCLIDGRVSNIAQGLPDRKINSLLPIGRELWIGTDNGVVRWNGSEITRADVPHALEHTQVLAMIRDHESNTWVAAARGLLRVDPRGVASLEPPDRRPNRTVTALFEDREGDLWVGSTRGMERWRDRLFLTYSPSEGSQPENNGPLYADAENRTWFAPSNGGLFWLSGTQIHHVTNAGLDNDVVYSIAGGPGELWAGRQRGGLTRLRSRGDSFAAETYTQADGLAPNIVYAVHRSHDGTVWAGTLGGGVSRFTNGRFTTYTTRDGLAANTVAAIEEGSDGTMWFATPNGLSAFVKDRWRTFTGRDGLPPGEVNCLFEDSSGVLWIGTAQGLAFFRSGRIQVPANMPEVLHEAVFGVAEDRSAWLWIATSDHVLRVQRDRLLNASLNDSDVREYGVDDGLSGTGGVKRHRSVVTDQLARIWFSLNRGLSVVDPARVTASSVPALVHIQAIAADGSKLDTRRPVRIPPARRRITFNYIGLSLSSPDRVKYRYMLDGFDHGWSEPIAIREAVYTNLGPGPYRFRVMASNPDGLWNSPEAAIGFEIEPAIWQTWWFRLSVLLSCAAAFVAVYRVRLQQLTRQLNVRFEERLAERTRIAQELHDTLLQGFLSASMQLDVAMDRLPDDSPARPPLSRVLQLMRKVIDEGRNAVRGLRSSQSASLDLEQAFSQIQQELAIQAETSFRVIVDGQPRPLRPLLRDEVYRIGREALANAFRHSGAKNIEIELQYTARQLRVLVRDNGCGIDPQVVQSGREGHWGLVGMRERAERIGGRLHVWSSAAAGTEVELSVPRHVAFQSDSSGRLLRWFDRLHLRGARAQDPESNNGRDR